MTRTEAAARARAARWARPGARERQAELIHGWRPWEQAKTTSTGPRTAAGKAICSRNRWRGVAEAELLAREQRTVAAWCLAQADRAEHELDAMERIAERMRGRESQSGGEGSDEPATFELSDELAAACAASVQDGVEAVIAGVRARAAAAKAREAAKRAAARQARVDRG